MPRSKSYLAKYPKTEYFRCLIVKRIIVMRISLVLITALLMVGCAPAKMMSIKQSSCESQFTRFEDVVSCTKEAYKNDGMARENDNTKLYFLKGDQLVQKLKKGDITEADARAEWQQTLVDMTKGHGGGVPYQPYQRSRYCAPSGNGVVCY